MLKSWARALPIGLVVLFGCGGGSGLPLTNSGTTVTAGSFVIGGQAKEPQLATAGSSGITIYAISGNLTIATLRDQSPTLAETEIIHMRTAPSGYGMYACAQDGSDPRLIVTASSLPGSIKVHPTGVYVYYTLGNNLYRVSLAGGNPSPVLTNVASFGFTPSGNKLIVRRTGNNDIATANPDGSGAVTLGTYAENLIVANGMSETVGLFSGGGNLYRMNLTVAATPAVILAVGPNPLIVSYLPGHRFAFVSTANGANYDYSRVTATDATPASSLDNVLSNLVAPVGIAPDDSQLCFCDGNGALRLYGSTVTAIAQVADLLPHSSPSAWTPFVPARNFVGINTLFPTGAAALLFSENEFKVPTVVTADCTTRASMTTTRVSQDNTTNVVFQLDCDQLTNLTYTKSNGFIPVQIVAAASGLKGALISFSANTGKVTTVVTFTKRPTLRQTPNGYEASGEGLRDVIRTDGTARPATGVVRL